MNYQPGRDECNNVQPGYQGAIKVDNANRLVYLVRPNETAPIIIYNFNLQIGDSLAA